MVQKRKIILADYISYTDKHGKPVGHPLKVMQEYGQWIDEKFQVIYAAQHSYLNSLRVKEAIDLQHNICEGKNYSSIKGKLHQLFISWKNISQICKYDKNSYIWFCNIDIFLIFYLYFHKKEGKRAIVTTYLKEFPSKYQNKMFNHILPYIRLLICSNLENSYDGSNKLYMPDYLYDRKFYDQYKKAEKNEKAICVGTMGYQKELRKLVETFNKSGYPLEIIGYFSDKDLYTELCNIAEKNISIVDTYLQYEEYLDIISESKFCILPYRKDIYFSKTSGVLLESIFLDTIPICHRKLLEKWKVYGIGYGELEEFGNVDLFNFQESAVIEKNKQLIMESYNKEVYIERLISKIEDGF